MSGSRRLALVLTLALATVVMTAVAAFAQGGSPNPSGGTSSCRPGFEEPSSPLGLGATLPKGFTIGFGVRTWFNTFAPSRYTAPTAGRTVTQPSLSAVAPRRVWSR